MCQFALHYYIYMYYALLFYWVYFKSYIINIIYLFCCYKHAFAFCFREVPWGKYQQNVCFYKKRLFSQIRQSYCLKHLTIFLCPEAKSPLLIISTPLTLSGHHLITKQGTSQCFLIILPPPSGHLLMMKNLLQEVWTFVFIIILLLFIFSGFFFFLSWGFVFVFFFHVFALRLEIWCPELECATSLFHTFSYGITCIHCGFTLNLSSFPSKAGALTKLVQREGEI